MIWSHFYDKKGIIVLQAPYVGASIIVNIFEIQHRSCKVKIYTKITHIFGSRGPKIYPVSRSVPFVPNG